MAMRGGRGPAAVVAAMIAVLVAGCTGGADPVETTTPTVTTSPEPSPSPTPSPTAPPVPERPSAMGAAGPDGAAAAASYFMQLYPYVLATGDLAEWDALSAPTCDFCGNTRTEVEELQAAGRRSVGAVTILSAVGKDLGANGWHSATVEVELAPSEDIDASGAVVDTNGGGRYTIDVALTWADGWTIDSAGIVEAPST